MAAQIADLVYAGGDEKEAQSWYQEGLQILQNSLPANRYYYQSLSLVCVRLARGFRHENKKEEAERYLNQACGYLGHYRVMPADTDLFFLLNQSVVREKAWHLALRGQLEEAEQMCRDCIETLEQRFGDVFYLREFYDVLEVILAFKKD